MPGCFAKHVNARDRRTKKRYRSRRTAAKGSIEASILPGIITAISHNRQILLAVCAGYAQERSATSFGLRALRHLCFSTAPSALQRENAPTPKWPRRDICDNLARDNVEKASPLRIGLLQRKESGPKRAKSTLFELQILLLYQIFSRWLGRQDSNQGMATPFFPLKLRENFASMGRFWAAETPCNGEVQSLAKHPRSRKNHPSIGRLRLDGR